MKLKLNHKPDKSSQKDALIIHVEYGGGEDSQGNKIPHKKHIQKCSVGETIEVKDEIGYAILGRYRDCFQMVQTLREPPTQTAAGAAAKETKDATPTGTK